MTNSVVAGIVYFWTSTFVLPARCTDIIRSMILAFYGRESYTISIPQWWNLLSSLKVMVDSVSKV